jgi:predicted amidohydrolase YtcJ
MRFTLVFTLLCLSAAAQQEPADLVIRNARIWTGTPSVPWAQSAAVRDGKFIAVGASKDVAKFLGPASKTFDAGGKLIVPGFNDAHTHFLSGSLRMSAVDLNGAATLEEMQRRVAEYARANPRAAWITGGGWEYYCFPGSRLPTREDLDAVVKDRPVFLSAYDGHTTWANSKALEIAGVTKDTKFDGFGELVRDPKTGEPTGCFKEAASSLVRRHVPPVTRQQELTALEKGIAYAASLGITSIQNASGDREELALWQQLESEGKPIPRVSMAISIGPEDKGCAAIRDLRGRYHTSTLRVGSVKFMLDGVIESHTAAMLDDYAGSPGDRGQLSWEPDAYKKAVVECDADGWQIYTHAIGDRAVRLALDGFDQARRVNGKNGRRHRIEHIEIIHPADVLRFAQLNVTASMMPIHADPGTVDVWSKAVGEKRLPLSFAWGALQRADARLVFSSDWPATMSCDPIRGLHNAVNRQTIEGVPAGGWLPDQKVDLDTALRAYTFEGAYSSFEEVKKGRIAVGQMADFVVLSQDLFKISPQLIYRTKVTSTYVGGRQVFPR